MATLCAGAILTSKDEVAACGAFFSRDVGAPPSLAVERVLIVHDPGRGVEHFIREVVFRSVEEAFGFVVPVPSRPEVASVQHSPFKALERHFPWADPPPAPQQWKGDFGSGHGRLGGVQVLETQKIGSFTSVTLAADDPKALVKWLQDNGFTSRPNTREWLDHYVRRGFYFVAFRFEGPEPAGGRTRKAGQSQFMEDGTMKSEIVRISFAAPAAFYPYREPLHEGAPLTRVPRLLALWVISPEPVVPVAMVSDKARDLFVRPLAEGWRQPSTARQLRRELTGLASLIQDRAGHVQPFEDQKTFRLGYGDIVFLPEAGVPDDRRERVDAFARRVLLTDP